MLTTGEFDVASEGFSELITVVNALHDGDRIELADTSRTSVIRKLGLNDEQSALYSLFFTLSSTGNRSLEAAFEAAVKHTKSIEEHGTRYNNSSEVHSLVETKIDNTLYDKSYIPFVAGTPTALTPHQIQYFRKKANAYGQVMSAKQAVDNAFNEALDLNLQVGLYNIGSGNDSDFLEFLTGFSNEYIGAREEDVLEVVHDSTDFGQDAMFSYHKGTQSLIIQNIRTGDSLRYSHDDIRFMAANKFEASDLINFDSQDRVDATLKAKDQKRKERGEFVKDGAQFGLDERNLFNVLAVGSDVQ